MYDVKTLGRVTYVCACIVKASVFSAFSEIYNCMAFTPEATGSCWTTTINYFQSLLTHQYLSGLAEEKDLVKDSWNPEFTEKSESELKFTLSQSYSFAK